MPVHGLIHIIKQDRLLIQLVSHLYAQISLPPYALAQPVQLIVLITKHLFMVRMDLLIGKPGVAGGGRRISIGLVAVRSVEQCGAVLVVR